MMFKLGDDIHKKDENTKNNAILKAKRETKLTTSATDKTSHILSEIDLANPPKELDDYIDKRQNSQIAKLRRKLKTEVQKTFGQQKNRSVDTSKKLYKVKQAIQEFCQNHAEG